MNKEQYITLGDLYNKINELHKLFGGYINVHISVPYRDGLGLHYEQINNISIHSNIVDIHTTVPKDDDILKRK